MASLVELQAIVGYVTSHWPSSRAWSRPDALVDDFRGVSAAELRATLEAMFRQGRERAPGPSEVLAGALARGTVDRHRGVCVRHTWARPGPWDTDRVRVCAVCGAAGAVDVCQHSFNGRGVCRYCPALLELGSLPGVT